MKNFFSKGFEDVSNASNSFLTRKAGVGIKFKRVNKSSISYFSFFIHFLKIALYFLCIVVILIGGVSFLVSCERDTREETHLQQYFDSLPKVEEANGSLHNHEKMLEKMYEKLEQKEYLEVFSLYEKYDQLFFESDVEDKSEVYFLVGIALQQVWSVPSRRKIAIDFFKEGNSKFLGNVRQVPNLEESKVKDANKISGDEKKWRKLLLLKEENFIESSQQKASSLFKNPIAFFERIIEDRENYFLETAATKEIFFEKLQTNESKATYLSNIKFFDWAIRHYPTAVDYNEIFANKKYFKLKFRNKKYEKVKEAMDKILVAQRFEAVSDKGIYLLPNGINVVLRNRPNLIASRNLAVLQAWQPLMLLASHLGEDGENWFAVKPLHNVYAVSGYRGNSQANGLFASLQTVFYLPADSSFYAFHVKEETGNYDADTRGEGNNLKDEKGKLTFERMMKTIPNIAKFDGGDESELVEKNTGNGFWKLFVETHLQTATHNFFEAMENTVVLQRKGNAIQNELVLMLQHNVLKQIAERSTSLESSFTLFVKKFPRFFVASNDGLLLYPSEDVLLRLLSLNPETGMAQYFDGLLGSVENASENVKFETTND